MCRASIELLESRQLLSANCSLEILDDVAASRQAVTVALLPSSAAEASAPIVAAATPAENLLGTFAGEIKVKKLFFRKSFDAELTVTEVTATGITGKLTVEGNDVEGTFPGKINPKGTFKYRAIDEDYRVELRGKISPDGQLIKGKARFKAFGLSTSGEFKMRKQA